MAIYRLEAKIMSRAKGQSAVAAAAYRSGSDLRSERDQDVKMARSKSEVVHSEILVPDGAPDWATDREALWNAVERRENRKNSQLAREVLLSLPRELGAEEQKQLTRRYVQSEFVARGMVADVNIHHTTARDGEPNPHAHVMLTLRAFDPKTKEWAKHKNRAWNDRENIARWRAAWQEAANAALEDAGSSARVDHRSLAARGIDRKPQPKLGPTATQMERAGASSRRGRDVRRTRVENDQRAIYRRTQAAARQHPGGLRGFLAQQAQKAYAWRQRFAAWHRQLVEATKARRAARRTARLKARQEAKQRGGGTRHGR